MLRQYRFLMMGTILGLAAFIVALSLLGAETTSANGLAATMAATGPTSTVKGDVARGKYLVTIGACVDCHGAFKYASDKGVPLAGGNEFQLGPLGTYYSANLTALQKWTTADFIMALRQGVDPQSKRVLAPVMPYANYNGMSDTDIASIGEYLKSLAPVQNDVPAAKPGPAAAVALHPLPAKSVPDAKISDRAEYGAYIVQHVSSCGDCHSPRDITQQPIKGKDLTGGGINLGSDEEPLFASPIVGPVLVAEGYTKENFISTIRTGVRPWGAKLPVQMPWRQFANMTDNDLTAVWNYLQTLKLDKAWPVPVIPPQPGQATMAATAAR